MKIYTRVQASRLPVVLAAVAVVGLLAISMRSGQRPADLAPGTYYHRGVPITITVDPAGGFLAVLRFEFFERRVHRNTVREALDLARSVIDEEFSNG